MSFRIIDTHCHLDIIQEQGQEIEVSLKKAKSAGVQKILQIGIDLESSIRAKKIAHTDYDNFGDSSDYPSVHYSIGCHPTETHEFPKAEEIIDLIDQNISDPKLSAIGEIGIDLYHTADSKNIQIEILEKFLEVSARTKIPVVIHSREGFQDTYDVLKSWKTKATGVIHCFTYDYNAGKKFVDLGYYVSLSGIVAFKSAHEIQDAATKLPLDALLIETDAPFLAPPPFRGKRNESSNMPIVLEKIFSLRSESNAVIEEKLFSNSQKFLNRKAYYDA
ncbi:TatD family hydrolase [Leptospira sp. GIMC2001]|uniref:TatD family hydrolase n=1 Tax=Leptospira sp. GIMC2001 TaxID=1513297 RepID=UPI00234B1434|nr:TatD family hydrolase [Leptospira sp. GIMC2001]WCL49510.1 TatD family hydrolase [Leptospira sp. GIMC2001]